MVFKNIAYHIAEVKLVVMGNSNLQLFNFVNVLKSRKSQKFDAHEEISLFYSPLFHGQRAKKAPKPGFSLVTFNLHNL